jgi:hypothetical protein
MNSPINLQDLPSVAGPPAPFHRDTPRLGRISATAFVIVSLLSSLGRTRAAEDIEIVGDIVELPKFEVTDSRLLPPPEKWLYAEIPGFEILSGLSRSSTQRFVKDFLLLQEAMNVIMPGLRAGPVAVPTSLILTGRGDQFSRFMASDRGDDRYRTNTQFFRDDDCGGFRAAGAAAGR